MRHAAIRPVSRQGAPATLAILVLLWYLDVRLMVWYSLFFLGMY